MLEVSNVTVAKAESYFNFSSGFMLAIVANILWGTSFLASKYTLQAWGPFTSSALRFGIATICLLGILKAMKKKIDMPENSKQWIGLIVIATSAFGILYPMQLAGLKFIPTSLSAAIMLFSPLAVLSLSRIVLKERLSSLKYVALMFGVVGGGVLLSSTSQGISIDFNSNFVWGTFLTLTSAVSLAISVIATRKYSKDISSASITFWTMAIGFLELSLAAFIFEENVLATINTNSNMLSWVSLFFLAFVCSAFSFYIWNQALSKASPQEIASSMHIKTPTAVLIGVFIANEELTSTVVIGTALVMFGVWLSQQKKIWGLE
ncbi:MAG TPA: DMT family transporter [Bacteriovoracaceae bacterium]|nr:DMT family transporter [Bacteriovoracaceae bacterium]